MSDTVILDGAVITSLKGVRDFTNDIFPSLLDILFACAWVLTFVIGKSASFIIQLTLNSLLIPRVVLVYLYILTICTIIYQHYYFK